ncbi:MAG: nucleotidyltransferase domain-containing protein [Chloroflexi bacterium]|nr:nucleotidyltransferase domain-containing protein [Chloroflexota bacterium]
MVDQEQIRIFRDQIVKEFQPEKIILFGSYAYGKPTADSDVDVLIVLPFEGKNPEKATEIWMAAKPNFPVDILVRRPEEIETRLAMGDNFIREIVDEGMVLYEADNA